MSFILIQPYSTIQNEDASSAYYVHASIKTILLDPNAAQKNLNSQHSKDHIILPSVLVHLARIPNANLRR